MGSLLLNALQSPSPEPEQEPEPNNAVPTATVSPGRARSVVYAITYHLNSAWWQDKKEATLVGVFNYCNNNFQLLQFSVIAVRPIKSADLHNLIQSPSKVKMILQLVQGDSA